jgi:hypothetical protein
MLKSEDNMIHFNKELVNKTLTEIKEIRDCADVGHDMARIKDAQLDVRKSGKWRDAEQLDYELRRKYPSIDNMLAFARKMALQSPRVRPLTITKCDEVIENLTQDYYGILCDTAIKKELIPSMKEFIDFVD